MKIVIRGVQVLLVAIVLSLGINADAMMGSWGPGMMGPGMFGGTSNGGGFGMMNGMTGAPVVGDDGTAYLVSYTSTANPGTVPNSGSFQSTVLAFTPTGGVSTLVLKGIVSRPVVVGNVLVATASLPDFSNYSFFGNYGTIPGGQSVIYIVTAPFTNTTVPEAVSMDGSFASMPVIAGSHVYVTTSDWGNAMMNNMANWMYGNYNFNSTGTAKTYLYIFNFDGSLVSKTVVQ